MALTTRIKEYREMQGLKQSDLAKVFHVTVEDLFSYDD